MTHATHEVRTAGRENPSYGTPGDVARLLDGVGVILRGEDQAQWDDADLREATEALRRHLAWRMENRARRAAH